MVRTNGLKVLNLENMMQFVAKDDNNEAPCKKHIISCRLTFDKCEKTNYNSPGKKSRFGLKSPLHIGHTTYG